MIDALPGQDYFGVLPNNTLIAAKGSKLFVFDPTDLSDNAEWKEIVDLSTLNITNIESIDVNSKMQLLLVTKD